MNKLYLPKDENAVFSILSSSSGLVIPLVNFGYPNLHLTFFFRELSSTEILFNVHVKDEISNTNLVSKNIRFNPFELKEKFEVKLKKLIEVVNYHTGKWQKRQINQENIFCLDCFREKKTFSSLVLDNRQDAEKFYGSFPMLIRDIKTLKTCPICITPRHSILWNTAEEKIYYQMAGITITEKELEEYSDDIIHLFQEELDFLSDFFDSVKKEFVNLKLPKGII